MDAAAFYGLRRAEAPGCFELPIVPGLCSGLGALFGGAGLGACIEALERTTGRPLVWATAQFLAFAPVGTTMLIEVTEAVRGHQVSQARAVGRVDGTEILTVNAALGRRPSEFAGSWEQMPEVPPPEACPPRRLQARHMNSIMANVEMRMARARDMETFPAEPGDGRSALWVRMGDLDLTQASLLAIFGDFVPFGIGQALGQRAGGNSIDNTLRVAHRHPTDWVLADIRVHAIADGFGHGLVHLWARDGVLLGTASQSTIVRRWQDEPTTEPTKELR
ncbi:MAG: acyl-CoA thioesterase [Acidimicrobiia bacterium]